MKALDYTLLADENVNPEVVEFLRKAGLDVESIAERGKVRNFRYTSFTTSN